MGGDRFRQWQVGGEQKRGPVDAMEADDFFANEVQVGRPPLCEVGLILWRVVAVADGGDVVRECVEPDVGDVLLCRACFALDVFRDGNAPGEGAARDGEVFEGAGDVGSAGMLEYARVDELRSRVPAALAFANTGVSPLRPAASGRDDIMAATSRALAQRQIRCRAKSSAPRSFVRRSRSSSVLLSMRSRSGRWKALSRKKKFSSVTISVIRPQSGHGSPGLTSTKASSETQ